MNDLEKAARMALEALECDPLDMAPNPDGHMEFRKDQAITALRQALEQPAQQQVDDDRVMTVVYRNVQKEDAQSFMNHPKAVWFGWCHAPYQRDDARYKLEKAVTSPQRKPWVGLTPEEVKEISLANRPYVVDMVVALEQRLKEKNT